MIFKENSHPKELLLCHCLGLNYLRVLKRSFLGNLNPIRSSSSGVGLLNHFFLHCPIFTNKRQNLLHNIESIIPDILKKTDNSITSILLYGDPRFWVELSTNILHSPIDCNLSAKGFKSPLFTETGFVT